MISDNSSEFPDVLTRFEGDPLELNFKNNTKIVLMSDHHFSNDNESYFSDEAIQKTISLIPSFISQINPDVIMILGDFFHGSQDLAFGRDFCLGIFSLLNNLNIPVKIISGNHDRNFYDSIEFSPYEYIEYSNCHFIKVNFYSEKDNNICFLTHDGNNGYWIPEKQKKSFVHKLKLKYEIPSDQWLISGHTHSPFVDKEIKIASLGCFNLDSFKHHNTILSFGILEWKESNCIFNLHDLGNSDSMYNSDIIEEKIKDIKL